MGEDKSYDTADHIVNLPSTSPRMSRRTTASYQLASRHSAINARTTLQEGYASSQSRRWGFRHAEADTKQCVDCGSACHLFRPLDRVASEGRYERRFTPFYLVSDFESSREVPLGG